MKYVLTKGDALRYDLENPARSVYIWVDEQRGAKNISAGTAEVPVNGELSYHSHEVEEIMLIYGGEGVAVVDGNTFPVEPETMVYVPPGIRHKFRNTASEPLIFAFFYAPPGTEQIYRRMKAK